MFDCKCIECGETFEAKTSFAGLCSSRCKMRRYRRTDKGKSNVIRFSKSVKRTAVTKKCLICGDEFKTSRNAKYCGDGCYWKSPDCKASRISSHRKSKVIHCIRHSANKKVSRAVKDGRLKRLPCEVCGSNDDIEGHHDDYSKPYEVRWMCSECHTKHHVEVRGFG